MSDELICTISAESEISGELEACSGMHLFASGSFTPGGDSSYTVSGLKFRPSVVVVFLNTGSNTSYSGSAGVSSTSTYYLISGYTNGQNSAFLYAYRTSTATSGCYIRQNTLHSINITDDGFEIVAKEGSSNASFFRSKTYYYRAFA